MINQLLNDPYCKTPRVEWNDDVTFFNTEYPLLHLDQILQKISDGEIVPKISFNNEIIESQQGLEELLNSYAETVENSIMYDVVILSRRITPDSIYFSTNKEELLKNSEMAEYGADRNIYDLFLYRILLEFVLDLGENRL